MAKKLQRRLASVMKKRYLRNQARKNNAPATGVKISLEEQNRVVLDAVLAKLKV
jgi:hypothetical protein